MKLSYLLFFHWSRIVSRGFFIKAQPITNEFPIRAVIFTRQYKPPGLRICYVKLAASEEVYAVKIAVVVNQ